MTKGKYPIVYYGIFCVIDYLYCVYENILKIGDNKNKWLIYIYKYDYENKKWNKIICNRPFATDIWFSRLDYERISEKTVLEEGVPLLTIEQIEKENAEELAKYKNT